MSRSSVHEFAGVLRQRYQVANRAQRKAVDDLGKVAGKPFVIALESWVTVVMHETAEIGARVGISLGLIARDHDLLGFTSFEVLQQAAIKHAALQGYDVLRRCTWEGTE